MMRDVIDVFVSWLLKKKNERRPGGLNAGRLGSVAEVLLKRKEQPLFITAHQNLTQEVTIVLKDAHIIKTVFGVIMHF